MSNLIPATRAQVAKAIEQQLNQVNHYHLNAMDGMKMAADNMILCGLALLSLREQVPHGGWEQLFEGAENRVENSNETQLSHFNFSYKTAQRYMALGTKAKERILALQDVNQNIPFIEWSEDDRYRVAEAIRDQVNGQSYSDLAREWGLAKPKPAPHVTQLPEPKDKVESSKKLARADIDALILKMEIMAGDKAYWMSFASLDDLQRIDTAIGLFRPWLTDRIRQLKNS